MIETIAPKCPVRRSRPTNPHRSSPMLLVIVAAAALLAAAFTLDKPLWNGRISAAVGVEPYRLLLQFLLITMVGGGVFAYVTARREDHARRESRIAALQALDRELGDAYRAVKRVKRKMRSRLVRSDGEAARMPADTFISTMDELLEAQIDLEEVREHVSVRSDLLEAAVVDRLSVALRYSSRYLHDVFEDFERGRVVGDGDHYIIDRSSPNIEDFLLESRASKEVRKHLSHFRDDALSAEKRLAALRTIDSLRDSGSEVKARYGEVAMECLRFSSADIRRVISIFLS